MPPDLLVLYVGTMALVVLIPGPTVLCVVSQAGRHGFRRSLAGIAGVQVGHVILFSCVGAGLATFFATGTIGWEILRIAGALYLAYLGLRILFFTAKRNETVQQTSLATGFPTSLFLQALATQISNPKAFLFVSAYLPQFMRPEYPVVTQLLILLLVTMSVETVILAGYAYMAARSFETLRHSVIARWLERILGGVLLFMGARLLFEKK